MSYPKGPYAIINGQGKVVGELGTGRLIQAGGGEAYEDGGFWRLRDDAYDAKLDEPPVYTRVYVRQLKQCRSTYGIPHYVEWGALVIDGLCNQCRADRADDQAARAART